MGIVEQYLLQLNTAKRRWRRAVAVLTALSLGVAVFTVWNLRMTGITIANSGGCGHEEHSHGEECYAEDVILCTLQEHIHDTSCYSDPKADVETTGDWDSMFADYPYTGDLRKDLVGIAKTQVGYEESQRNFEVSDAGNRRGYTRYGGWYGAPYNDWSAMFVSFCLQYAGADPGEFPYSSGADSMAELWNKEGKFRPTGQYIPQEGDIVFFRNNTVGIVTEVYSTTFSLIRGDVDGGVAGEVMAIDDATVTGWGIPEKTHELLQETTEETTVDITEAPTEEIMEPGITETVATEPEITESETVPDEPVTEPAVTDLSQGPVFYIYEGAKTETEGKTYSLRGMRSVVELLPYLEANGGGYFFTLLDNNNMELPKDDQGNYIVQANTNYKLTISFSSPEGFSPGTYRYQIPNGLMVKGGEGSFVLQDGTNVGTWTVTDTGLITLDFNENMNSRSDITISANLGIAFPEQEDPIDFDGKITVTVEKPPQQQYPTQLVKWGNQGNPSANAGQDPKKLYWNLQIVGNKDSQIPGNILSDQVLSGEWSKDHSYTASDIAGGLTFGVSEPDPVTGEFKDWHSWHVSPDDPRLIWTETGWSYKIPETVTCQWCGEVKLGNENWIYTVNYTSTPNTEKTAGTYGYENEASVDGQHAYAWTDFTHGEAHGEITKTGTLISDGSGGNYIWEFQATIPAMGQGELADYHWYIMDYMYLISKEGTLAGYMENDANASIVTANYNGTTIQVPKIQGATENDPFAWDNAWTATHDGVNYGREFSLLCRCRCNESNCQFWNGKCENYWFEGEDGVWITNGYCQCWTVEENVTFTFLYSTEALPVIENYGGFGYELENVAELHYKPDGATGTLVSSSHAMAPIPGLFKKELTQDFNGYTAHYQITVNEAKAVLTTGSPLKIHDEMTDTLAYISGSLVITAEDGEGKRTTLRQGVHYTVTYDGTGVQKDESGNKVHVLDIVILQPQPVMYILDYDTTLIIPEHVTGGVKYSNSATVTLWGEEISDPGVEKVYADINIAAKTYEVAVLKTCAVTHKVLPGATFGLYNAQGGLITTGVTDGAGRLNFRTNVTEGVILREHELYYVQEVRPPPAYRRDESMYWLCFCSGTADNCETCEKLLVDTGGLRIPFEQVGEIRIENEPTNLVLPATGGVGNYVYILCGLTFTLGPLVYGFSLRRRYGRRSKE